MVSKILKFGNLWTAQFRARNTPQKKEKIINEKSELSEKSKDFERNGNHWLEPRFAFAKGGD